MTEHLLQIDAFLGIDNTSDQFSISVPKKSGLYCYQLDNVDVDDAGKLHRRDGYGAAVYSGTRIHSLWANDDICLFCDNGTFYKLSSAYATTSLMTGLHATDPMAYVWGFDHYVFFSNSSVVGYIDTDVGTTTAFTTPTQTYKSKMVGGQCLEIYNSRLYAANGRRLYYSDASAPTQRDSRRDIIDFQSRITMVKAVNNGLYVSDSDRVFFMTGDDPETFVLQEVLDIPAIEGMSVTNNAPGRKPSMKTVLFMTESGLYEGFPQGQVVIQQEGLYEYTDVTIGTAVIKSNGYSQYVGMGRY